jgi:hypothetical protein
VARNVVFGTTGILRPYFFGCAMGSHFQGAVGSLQSFDTLARPTIGSFNQGWGSEAACSWKYVGGNENGKRNDSNEPNDGAHFQPLRWRPDAALSFLIFRKNFMKRPKHISTEIECPAYDGNARNNYD